MSTNDPDGAPLNEPTSDRTTLVPFTSDAVEFCRQRVRESPPAPDFGAMLIRLRELDPAAMPRSTVAQAENLGPPISLAQEAPISGDPTLTRFTAVLRSELDARLGGPGQTSVQEPSPSPRRRVAGLVAAAAVMVLIVAIGLALVAQKQDLVRGDVQANADATPESQGEAIRHSGAWEALIRRGDEVTSPPENETEAVVDAPEGPVVEIGPEPGPSAPTPAPKRRQPPNTSSGPTLEEEAQALWQRGELAAAEQKYRQILRVSGRSRRAEFAYADLFSLMRQSHGSDGQSAEWTAYLKRFPRGRFADDARAGLCQRASASERDLCWRDYLKFHPDGVHRGKAKAALGDDEANP